MKIYVKNNRIVCSLENKNSNFWYGAEYKYFVGGVRYDTRYALVRSMDYQYKTLREASDDLKTLTDMLRDAERHNIEIDEAVYEWRKRLQSKVSELLVIDQAAKEKVKRREQWELKCKHGCGRCRTFVTMWTTRSAKRPGSRWKQRTSLVTMSMTASIICLISSRIPRRIVL